MVVEDSGIGRVKVKVSKFVGLMVRSAQQALENRTTEPALRIAERPTLRLGDVPLPVWERLRRDTA